MHRYNSEKIWFINYFMQKSTKIIRSKGRPRKFDEEIALGGAARIFTEKGYSATSLDELALAMGINRPSMYNAFGNKEAIFILAVEHYFKGLSAPLAEALQESSLDVALEKFFEKLLDFYCSDSLGCMATSAMPVESSENQTVKLKYKDIMNNIDSLLEQRLIKANYEGDSALCAQLIQAVMQTLSLRVRSGAQRKELTKLYRYSLKAIIR